MIAAPKIKSVTQTHIKATVKWDAVAKAKRYAVYCKEEKVGEEKKLGETTNTSYTATDLTPKTDYAFRVEAIRDSITSARSGSYAFTTTSVPTPKNITAEGGWDSVTLSWDPVEGAEGYYIRSDETDLKERVTGTSYTVSDLEPFARYTFYVQAYIEKKYSTLTAGQVKTKTGFQAPGNLQAISVMETSAILTWDPVDGADKYRIYKANGTSEVATTEECSYKLTGLSKETEYTYYVAAGKDGSYGLLDDDNKVSFTTIKVKAGFKPNENISLTYGDAHFYLGQAWKTDIKNKLIAASNGYEVVSRPGYADDGWDGYDATKYIFDTNDYSDFLAVTVADGKIISWETNGLVFGTYYGVDVVWGDDTKDYPYGSKTAYRTRGSACSNIFTEIDRGDTIIGGFSFKLYPDETQLIQDNEKKIGYHYINAYRVAAGLSILPYSDALDGHNYKWSGTARGKDWDNVRYGAQPLAETVDASKPAEEDIHSTETMTKGPLAGQTMNERNAIIYNATTLRATGENIATGNIGESCLAAYMDSNPHMTNIVREDVTMIGIGIYGKFNAQIYSLQ